MAGPWDRFAATAGDASAAKPGPWQKFAPPDTAPKVQATNVPGGMARDFVESIPIIGPVTTGITDLIASNIIAAFTGQKADEVIGDYKKRHAQYEKENPIPSTVAKVAGAVGGTAAASAPLAATKIGSTVLGMTGPWLSRAAFGASTGGTTAAVDSLIRTKGDTDKAGEAFLYGAGGGAVGGVAAPYLAKGVDSGVRYLRGAFGLGNQVDNMSNPAREMLRRAVEADVGIGQPAVDALLKVGPRAMPADIGPSTTGLLDAMISRGGKGAKSAKDAVNNRAALANDDIAAALDETLGTPVGVNTAETAIRRGSAGARSSTYKDAYGQRLDYDTVNGKEVRRMLSRVPTEALTLANKLIKGEGEEATQLMWKIADDGEVRFFQMPNVRQIDYITRALNTMAKSGEGQGALGGQTDVGRVWQNLSRDLRNEARVAVPEYNTALETAAAPIAQREALRFGEDLLSSNLPRDVARDQIDGMTGPEKLMVQQGVRSQIDEVLANVRAVASDPNIDARQARKALMDLSSPAAREKLAMLLTPEEAEALFKQLDQSSIALQLVAGIAQNSKTAPRLMADEILSSEYEQGVVNAALQGKPINAAQAAVQGVTGRSPADIQRLKDADMAQIGEFLTAGGGNQAQAIEFLDLLNAAALKPDPKAIGVNAAGSLTAQEIERQKRPPTQITVRGGAR